MRQMPYIGYRIWRADDQALRLYSLCEDTPWPLTGDQTSNHPPSKESLGIGGYGFHAMYRFLHGDVEQVRFETSFELWYRIERIVRRLEKKAGMHWVAGAIVGWGEVAMHEHGFRAQHCRIVALHYQTSERDFNRAKAIPDMNPWLPPPRLQMIADRYGVPLADSPSKLHAYASEWGRTVGPEMLAA